MRVKMRTCVCNPAALKAAEELHARSIGYSTSVKEKEKRGKGKGERVRERKVGRGKGTLSLPTTRIKFFENNIIKEKFPFRSNFTQRRQGGCHVIEKIKI